MISARSLAFVAGLCLLSAAEGGQGLARHAFGGRDFGPKVPAASIGGDFGSFMSTSDRFAYWNGTAGLALAMDLSMIKWGFSFSHNFSISMCNMAVPETGGFDMYLAVRALDTAPTDGNFDDLTELPRTATVEFRRNLANDGERVRRIVEVRLI